MTDTKILSIRQPWAYAILHLGKNIENRSRRTNHRGRFLIHTGKTFDKEGARVLGFMGHIVPDFLQTGGIVGEAYITDVVADADADEWFFGPYGYVLEQVKPLPFVPCLGKLGFFTIPGM